MPFNTPKPFGKSLRIAVLASGADLGAASDRIPGGISPLNCRVQRHLSDPLTAELIKDIGNYFLCGALLRCEEKILVLDD